MTEQVSQSGPPTCRGPRGPLPGEAAESAGEAAVKPGRPTLSSEIGIIISDITNPASLDEMATPATVVLNSVGPRPQLWHLHPCAALEREARSHRHDAAGVRTAGTLTVKESFLTLHSGPEQLP
ncbi:saccharopine dehydrogenase-like oxidoreductase [Camelus dromedarius]|uniref:saccharopine dehydrogenase-like oxidoreductase n=1 Tax=Camelus dromedarius TaxID=9838 RepID=UPI00311A0BCE